MLDFYDVDKDYINFLQNSEIDKRGFTCVPNMEYGIREQKFLCGIVLRVEEFNYYVPVSSYKQKQSESILIRFEDDKVNPVKGSLRFNYMVPVPDACIYRRNINKESNIGRRRFLSRQLRYIQSIDNRVYKQAERTYNAVTKGINPFIKNHACDFKFLEQKCLEYEAALNSERDENFEQPNIEEDLEL